MEKKIIANSISSRLVPPGLVFVLLILTTFFMNGRIFDIYMLIFPSIIFLIVIFFINYRSSVLMLTDSDLKICYPFKFFTKRNYCFILSDIDSIMFYPSNGGKIELNKIIVLYKKGNNLAKRRFSVDVSWNKIQELIFELQKLGVNAIDSTKNDSDKSLSNGCEITYRF